MASTPLGRYLRRQPDFNEPSSSSSPLPALYADLAAHRSSNRPSFEASVDWWARLLFKASLGGAQSASAAGAGKGKQAEGNGMAADRIVLHLDQQLVEECTVEEVGRPLGLGTVAMELQSSQRLFRLGFFLSTATPLQGPSTSRGGISSTVYKVASFPLNWAFSQISINLGFGEGDVEAGEKDWKKARGDWVMWDNLEAITDMILSIHRSSPRLSPLESLFSLPMFEKQLVGPALKELAEGASETGIPTRCSNLDLRVLIKHMERDRAVAVTSGQVIKLEHIEGEEVKALTEEEKGIVSVKETYSKLESQVDEIERRIKERQAKVEGLLKEKKRDQALSYLRSRRVLEELLEKRTKTLETLHGVLIKIEQAASDVEIVKAYETSTSSLKALLSDARLQPGRIESSMDQMQDTLADADEVRRAVEAGNEGMRQAAGGEELDEEDMAAELKRLEEENEEEKRQGEKTATEPKTTEPPLDVGKGTLRETFREKASEERSNEAVLAE